MCASPRRGAERTALGDLRKIGGVPTIWQDNRDDEEVAPPMTAIEEIREFRAAARRLCS